MNLRFYKYQGTGNDFVLLDNRDGSIELNREQIAFLCNRHMGIGADGLMLLEHADGYDFKMVYYNADGNESTMCGNGGRCITAFAKKLGVIEDKANFIAIDGRHEAVFNDDGTISLQMQDVDEIKTGPFYTVLNTGSPHYVKIVASIMDAEVVNIGRSTRNRDEYQPDGINVNFVQPMDEGLWVRTYERGVEDETLSCGTGVTASAIAMTGDKIGSFDTKIFTPGGNLNVNFDKDSPTTAKNVVLTGPALFVFEGDIEL